MEIKLAIVGTRNPKLSYKEWESLLLQEVSPDDLELIVSGGATGIDTYAKLFAGYHHIPLMEFIPDYANRGTFHSISEARKMHKQLIIKQI